MILSQGISSEGVIENLRILRSTVQFLMRDSDRNVIMITGPTRGVGKSFISANFAMVLAATGKNVLLIDCDMRAGNLHRYFGLERQNGLSDTLATNGNGESIIHREVATNVDFISTGNLPNQPAELLSHVNFGIFLRTLASRYDHVLIDTPPVLEFSDALIVGVHAEAIFNVVRDGVSSTNDAEEAVRRLNRAGLTVTGIILNGHRSHMNRHGYGARNVTVPPVTGYQNNDEQTVRLIAGKALQFGPIEK